MLNWTHGQDEFYATSCIHDEGSPFLYVFKRNGEAWDNKTEAELIDGPTSATFQTMQSAKRWAERTEARWRDVDFSSNAGPLNE